MVVKEPIHAPPRQEREPRRIWRFEILSLLLFLAAAGGAWAFIELADEVMEGSTRAYDEKVLLALRVDGEPANPIGPVWLENTARDWTALGSWGVLGLLTAATTLFFLLIHRFRLALLLLGAAVGGAAMSQWLKLGFDRPRPDLVPHGDFTLSASFPSGHAMMAAAIYLTLGGLLARSLTAWRVKSFVVAGAVFLTLLVGSSRVYLGVHWPSDVLAGWAAGATWATLCWLIARWLQIRGRIEPAAPQS